MLEKSSYAQNRTITVGVCYHQQWGWDSTDTNRRIHHQVCVEIPATMFVSSGTKSNSSMLWSYALLELIVEIRSLIQYTQKCACVGLIEHKVT